MMGDHQLYKGLCTLDNNIAGIKFYYKVIIVIIHALKAKINLRSGVRLQFRECFNCQAKSLLDL